MKAFLNRRSVQVISVSFQVLLFGTSAALASGPGNGSHGGSSTNPPATSSVPACNDAANSSPLAANPNQVNDWMQKNQNQFHGRALVYGTFVRVLPARDTHDHFEMQFGIDPQSRSTQRDQTSIEVVYNKEFGELPAQIAPGTALVVCGDYITIGSQGPLGAIIHWVHFNPGNRDNGRHPNGFVVVNQKLFGDQGDYITDRVQPRTGN